MRTALSPPSGPPRRPDRAPAPPGASWAALRAQVSARLPRWTSPVAVATVALAGCLTLAVMDPARRGELSPGCPFRTLTGWDCPGCGGTRAVYALTQGQWLRAVDHNVLVVALLPLLGWAWVGWLAYTLGRRTQAPTLPPAVTYGLAGLVAMFWIARNLPGLEWLGSMATWSLGG